MKIETIFDFGGRDRMCQGLAFEFDELTDEIVEEHFADVCENIKRELAKRRSVVAADSGSR